MTQSKSRLQPEQWMAVLDAVEAVIDVEPAERAARLGSLLDDDPVLVQSALDMLALEGEAYAEGARALDRPFDALSSASAPFAARGSVHRDEVGPYRLHEEIGRGGMGQVFLASRSDGSIDRRVALKLVHPGLGTKEVIARFERERQVQASLLHPGIAVLLDGGATADGLPYLVMEFVDGQRLDRWCDGELLSLGDRLALFIKVAGAVAYAHQSHVIHRDLKPSNILVTAEGQPKLLDFGIAKVLDGGVNAEETLTVEGMQRMTPAYASPEQLRGEEVTVATDIYSLGTLLFELLTGHTPHMLDGCSVAEIERSVCEESPRRPSRAVFDERAVRSEDSGSGTRTADAAELGRRRQSTPSALRRRIEGDLERIVMKCLRKEPERRYASVDGLIADLERYRDGRPILARPESWTYRASTFVRRHWVGVAAAATVIAALSAALTFSLIQNSRADESERVAIEKERLAEERLRSLMDFRWDMLNKVAPKINEMPGAMEARENILVAVMACLERETATLDGDGPRTEELIDTYLRLARLQGHPRAMNRGRVDAAEQTLRNAGELSNQLLVAFPGKTRAAWLRARVTVDLGSLLGSQGDYAGASSFLMETVELTTDALRDETFELRDRLHYLLYESLRESSDLALSRGELELAREQALASSVALENLIEEFPDQVYFLDGDRVELKGFAANIRNREGRFAEALSLIGPAHEHVKELLESHGPNAMVENMNEVMLSIAADTYMGLGRTEDALAAMQASVAQATSSVEASIGDIRTLESHVDRQLELGELLLRLGRIQEAKEAVVGALESADKNVEQRQRSYVNVLRRVDIESALARCADGLGNATEALALVKSAGERLDTLVGELGPRYETSWRRARLDRTHGQVLAQESSDPTEPRASLRRVEAIELLEAALAVSQTLVDADLGGVQSSDSMIAIQALLAELRAE